MLPSSIEMSLSNKSNVYARIAPSNWQQLDFVIIYLRRTVVIDKMMEIDEMTDENMPSNLHRFALFTCRAYSNRTQYTDLMLTKGPIIYELKGKHILTSCDLTITVLKGWVSTIMFLFIQLNPMAFCFQRPRIVPMHASMSTIHTKRKRKMLTTSWKSMTTW